MRRYGLRPLVALLTFGVGVAAASLLSFERGAYFEKRVVADTPVVVVAPSPGEAPPPRACNLVSRGVINGKAVSKPTPAYPPAAKAAGVQGTVTVKIEVNENGVVTAAEAVSGHPLLREAAEDAARLSRYSPTYASGQFVKVSGFITYKFVLN